MGKAIRTPARDAMLSHASCEVGRGWGFGLHQAMDQMGAVSGPLIVALVLSANGGYRTCFAYLLFPAILALLVIAGAARLYPHPQHLEVAVTKLEAEGLRRPYWLYIAAAGLLGAGYADFPLIAYHFGKAGVASPNWIPIFYAVAMGVHAVSALVLGRLFDRLGMTVLIAVPILSALFAPLVFLGSFNWAMAGTVLWGMGLGTQGSILKAALTYMVPLERRATGYGLFHAGFGLFWFLGSVLMGLLYDYSLGYLVAFSVIVQLLAIPLFFRVSRDLCPGG
jgi:MFS family permease